MPKESGEFVTAIVHEEERMTKGADYNVIIKVLSNLASQIQTQYDEHICSSAKGIRTIRSRPHL
jgi:hypothetical protein